MLTNSKYMPCVKKYVATLPPYKLGIWCLVAGFGTYFSMYAFRKPFNAVTYEGFSLFGSALKPILIVSQILGYMSSKFIGVKVISELHHSQRSRFMIGFMLFSLLMLCAFSFVPIYLKPLFIFGSALPLGMFWGLVFSYFEGRRLTEFFAIGLSISAIVSSGILKSFSRLLIEHWNLPDFFVPLAAGLIFLPIILGFIWMLAQIPEPQKEDIEERSARVPLDSNGRKLLFQKYAIGLTLLILVYGILTIVRDFRDNYAVEIMFENGYTGNATVFAQTEIIIGTIVLFAIALLVKIRSHIFSLKMVLYLCGFGLLLVSLSTWLLEQKLISPFYWMIAQGTGIYLGYVPFQIVLFERFLAAFKEPGNVGFLMYVSDSLGYLGSASLSMMIQSTSAELNWTSVFVNISYLGGILGVSMVLAALYYFGEKWKAHLALSSKVLVTGCFMLVGGFYTPSLQANPNQHILNDTASNAEKELKLEFVAAANQFKSLPEDARKAFNISFSTYQAYRRNGLVFSKAFYEDVLTLSRQLRLITISKQLIEDMNAAYPSNKEHCDCGKCHK